MATLTVFDSRRKPTTRRPFGSGILASCPHFRHDHSHADETWYVQQQADAAEDRWIDELYAQCVAQDRVDAGTN